ncbi:hypothetical protein Cgig2_003830 [Carnegiea gigantea]|uniref:Uncharacterized protein n=1 Tax=Carnegiea gigantea TaxID=171969 RepID=A0A9Q1KLW7_9CARY|nr:hypothetical protein Cgig2_003830 [Carnegiea gigantea]
MSNHMPPSSIPSTQSSMIALRMTFVLAITSVAATPTSTPGICIDLKNLASLMMGRRRSCGEFEGGSNSKRIPILHAKRFTMAESLGFYLPLGLHGRGKGSSALLKWCKEGVVVHDASHYSTNLEGILESDDKNGCESKQNTLKNAEHLSSSTLMLPTIVDPYFLLVKRSTTAPEAYLSSNLCGLSKDKSNYHSAGNLHIKEEEPSLLLSTYETDSSLPSCKDLWDVVNEVVHLPMEENFLCLNRQKESLDFFCIKEATSARSMPTKSKFSRLCRIMLLRDSNHASLLTGHISHSLWPFTWSIVLPLNWVKAFWIQLVVGLRKKHWIACDIPQSIIALNNFSTNLVFSILYMEPANVEKKVECCSLDMRSLKVTSPPPWTSINFGFNKVVGQVNGIDTSSNIRSHDLSAGLDCEIPDAAPINNSDSGCELLVVRISSMLTSFLKEVSGDHLLLFPKRPDRMRFSHLMKDMARLN